MSMAHYYEYEGQSDSQVGLIVKMLAMVVFAPILMIVLGAMMWMGMIADMWDRILDIAEK